MTPIDESRASRHLSRAAATPRRRLRTYVGRMLLGTALPGSGLLLSGRSVAGGLVLGLFVALVIALAAGVYYLGAAKAVAVLASDPTVLLIAAIVLAAVVLLVIGTLIWTADLNWPSPAGWGKKLVAALLAVLLAVGLIAPTARALQYVFITSNLMATVFADGPGGRRFGLNLNGDDWAGIPRVNVLLIGTDAEPDRPGVRTDTMMMASIDTTTGDTLLIGIPRNLENIPFPASSPLSQVWPEGYNCGDDCLLNEVWNEGATNAHLYPGDPLPGLTALQEAVTEITGLPPDYSVVVNMQGFQALVNAMGGVTINVQQRVPIGGKVENGQIVPGSIKGWIEPGVQHLDGYHAMWYSRGRATTDDFNRMGRQRCMVGAVVKQVNPWTMLERFPQLAQVINENVHTDVPQDHLPAWASLVEQMQKGKISSLSLNNKLINVVDPDYQHIREMIQAAMFTQPLPTPTYTDGRATPPAFRETPTPTSTPSSTSTSTWTSTPTPSSSSSSTGQASPSPAATTPAPDTGLVDVAAAC